MKNKIFRNVACISGADTAVNQGGGRGSGYESSVKSSVSYSGIITITIYKKKSSDKDYIL